MADLAEIIIAERRDEVVQDATERGAVDADGDALTGILLQDSFQCTDAAGFRFTERFTAGQLVVAVGPLPPGKTGKILDPYIGDPALAEIFNRENGQPACMGQTANSGRVWSSWTDRSGRAWRMK